MSAMKWMLTGIFLVLVSIFIVSMTVLVVTNTSLMHGVFIFVPFVAGVLFFLYGLLKKDVVE